MTRRGHIRVDSVQSSPFLSLRGIILLQWFGGKKDGDRRSSPRFTARRFHLQLLLARRSVSVTLGIEGISARRSGEGGSRLWWAVA